MKPLENFYRAPGMPDGYRGDFKECNAAASRARYLADLASHVARLSAGSSRTLIVSTRTAEIVGMIGSEANVRHSIEEYDAMLADEEGGCGICGRLPSETISLHIDHDHQSGRIRGLLCFRCNKSLGDLDDDPDLLSAALRYLGPSAVPRTPPSMYALAELKALRLAG